MDKKVKSFIVGKEPIPQWFKEKILEGKAKIITDEEGEMKSILVHSATKSYEAFPGDKIVLNFRGLSVSKAGKKEE